MSLVVHKYGGTSVGSIEKIRNVAQRVMERKKRGMIWWWSFRPCPAKRIA